MNETLIEQRVGQVEHFFSKLHVATVRLEAAVRLGDRLHVKGRNDDFVVKVKSMQLDHKPIEAAKAGQVVGIQMPAKAHAGDAVLRSEAKARWGWLSRLLGS